MRPKWFIFTLHPTYRLEQVVDSEEQMKQAVADHRKTYPDIPVYCMTIFELE